MSTYQELALALALGALVGLEREWSAKEVAGIRTFPLITALGTLCAQLAASWGGWLVAAGLLCAGAFMVSGQWAQARAGRPDPGVTTEFAALIMFAVGAGIPTGHVGPGLVVTGALAVLLYWKRSLHAFVKRIGEGELRAILRLVLIGLVILPVLPDRDYGPYEVLNPRSIWSMVVLIVGISLVAYVAYKIVGGRRGALLAGALGGLISSTAATIGFSRHAAGQPRESAASATMILIASSVVFVRVLGEVAVVAPSQLGTIAPPLLAMLAAMGLLSLLSLRRLRGEATPSPPSDPPSDLKGALILGALYAVVILAVAIAREHAGPAGLYAVAAISGLTDVDAITLSTAQLVEAERLEADAGWRLILLGALSNLVFKGGVVAALGPRRLLAEVARFFVPALVIGALVVVFWP